MTAQCEEIRATNIIHTLTFVAHASCIADSQEQFATLVHLA